MDDQSGRRPASAGPKSPVLSLVPRGAGGAKPPSEAALTRLALAARAGDQRAREALYLALTPDLDRIVAAGARLAWATDCPRRDGVPWDREDLRQESFLIFSDLITAWSGVGPFTPYLLAYFPWRLRNAWRKLRPDRPWGTSMLRSAPELAVDPAAVAEEARVLLEVLADRLPVIERTILLGHVRDGVTLSELARQLGQRPRQVRRRWQMVKRWLRDEIELSAGSRRPTLGPNRGPGHE
jgi:RNA polymerase sigma factor (sigma-70 family)